MVYGIALCTYTPDGLYSWSLLGDQVFNKYEEAKEFGSQHIREKGWLGYTTFQDEDSWNWRRQENDGEMDDLCMVCAENREDVLLYMRHLG